MDGTRRQSQLGKKVTFSIVSLDHDYYYYYYYYLFRYIAPLLSFSVAAFNLLPARPSLSLSPFAFISVLLPHSSPFSARSRLSGKYCAVRKDDVAKKEEKAEETQPSFSLSLSLPVSFRSSFPFFVFLSLFSPVQLFLPSSDNDTGRVDRRVVSDETVVSIYSFEGSENFQARFIHERDARRNEKTTGQPREKPSMDLARADTDRSFTDTRDSIVQDGGTTDRPTNQHHRRKIRFPGVLVVSPL